MPPCLILTAKPPGQNLLTYTYTHIYIETNWVRYFTSTTGECVVIRCGPLNRLNSRQLFMHITLLRSLRDGLGTLYRAPYTIRNRWGLPTKKFAASGELWCTYALEYGGNCAAETRSVYNI